jgi:hypothetical protein
VRLFATTGPGDGSVVVQVTPQPDVYFPKSNDAGFTDIVPILIAKSVTVDREQTLAASVAGQP